MKEDGDRQLCAEATKALAAVTALPAAATPEAALPALADAALALVRLFERARYLSLEQLGRERIEGDGGAKARPNLAPSAAPPVGSAPRSGLAQLHDRRNLKLVEGPLGHLTQSSVQLERDVLRHFAAYLEYGSLEVRKSAFERAKQLSEQHPAWPALDRTLREASVLETEPDLKTQLASLANAGFASKKPAQTTGSK